MTELLWLTIGGFIGYALGSVLTERNHQRALNRAILAEYDKERERWARLAAQIHRDEIETVDDDWVPRELEEM